MTIELIDMDTGVILEAPADKTSGLQFSGKPTERALLAEEAKRRLIGCYSNGAIHDRLSYHFVDEFANILYQALELMAQEKESA